MASPHPDQRPLAERRRPRILEEYVGQEHLLGTGGLLEPMLQSGDIPSLILWGPPGVGKTTLARLLTESLDKAFYTLSAVHSGVKEVRETIKKAKEQSLFRKGRPILFIDELHRFSKSQQDSLLGAVEDGSISLIGATTENPGFEVIPALLSRCQVFTLKPLSEEELQRIVASTYSSDHAFEGLVYKAEEWETVVRIANGDARMLLNIMVLLVSRSEGSIDTSEERLDQLLKANPLIYDKKGDQHYDMISALIKSIRGSDPNAAVYWLARMLEGGEDPKFISRRLIILAAEDIGLANPTAGVIAHSCFESVEKIGMPEGRIVLSQCVLYLSLSPKSNSAYMSINKAQQLVKETGNLEVPLALRNASNALMRSMDHGKGYKYAHEHPHNFASMEFMPDEIAGTRLYDPSGNPREQEYQKKIEALWSGKYEDPTQGG